MNTNLIKRNQIIKESLSQEHFFEELLVALTKENELNSTQVQKLQNELLELLAKKVRYFNHGESSSVKVEVAESIMASIYYTLSIYFKELEDLGESKEHLVQKGIEEIYELGKKRIKERVAEANILLNRILEQKIETANYAYNDTVLNDGLGSFFNTYDIDFAAQEASCDIDYFLFFTEIETSGIEYMEIYLKRLYLENSFSLKFNQPQVELLLSDYDKDYEHLLFNIFELVLANALALTLLKKDIVQLELYKEEVEVLQETLQYLSKQELEQTLQIAAKDCLEVLEIDDPEVIDYVHQATNTLVNVVKVKLELGKLEGVFIPASELRGSRIDYFDGEPMSQAAFKALSEEIRMSESVSDKVKLMRAEVSCLTDLMDLLDADCFFENEFIIAFEALEDMELALLVKANPTLALSESIINESFEKPWHYWLNYYLSHMEVARREQVLAISECIRL